MEHSPTVLLALIRTGLNREAAYQLVQDAAMKTWEVKHAGRDDADFLQVLKSDPAVVQHIKRGELEKLCSFNFHFKEVTPQTKRRLPQEKARLNPFVVKRQVDRSLKAIATLRQARP